MPIPTSRAPGGGHGHRHAHPIADLAVPCTRVTLVKIVAVLTSRANARDGRTPIAPGFRTPRFAVSRKSLSAESWGFGAAGIALDAGKTYFPRARPIETTVRECFVTQASIEAARGNAVVPPEPVTLARTNGAKVALPGGGFIAIPSTNRCYQGCYPNRRGCRSPEGAVLPESASGPITGQGGDTRLGHIVSPPLPRKSDRPISMGCEGSDSVSAAGRRVA